MSTSNHTIEPICIPLTKGFSCIIDLLDSDLTEFKWCANKAGYALRGVGKAGVDRRIIFMHRIILERILGRPLAKHEFTDHINGNIHDNRRNNLRVSTYSSNNRNTKKSITNKSGYKGVSWHESAQKWRATINIKRKQIHLGYFDTPEQAHEVYKQAAVKYFGEFARFE